MTNPYNFLTVSEVASRTGVPRPTVYRWLDNGAKGKGEPIFPGAFKTHNSKNGTWLIPSSALQGWEERRPDPEGVGRPPVSLTKTSKQEEGDQQ